MYKSPKYKSIQLNSVKDRQKYFKNLYDDVNKSRMAVQTITSFKNTETSFKKKIDQIQEELHNSMSRINHQTKKNVILNQLINLMKGQMFNFQKTQKREEQKNQSQVQKKIKKIQYDIQQILQNHNEQVAKITTLKQSANSGRSERVVFSNLFKKLQKQIKQNEESYKQNLIKSQIAKDKSKPAKLFIKALQKDNLEGSFDYNRHSQTNIDIFPIESGFASIQNSQPAFITLQRQKSFQGDTKKGFNKRNNTFKELSHNQIYDSKNSSRGFSDLISCYENFLQRIKVYMGFNDVEQTANYYKSIENSNQNLGAQVECYNEQICRYQNLIKDISLQKRHSECYENSKQLPLGSCRRIRISTDTDDKEEDYTTQDMIDILNELSSVMQLQINNDQVSEDTLKQLDEKLDYLHEQSDGSDFVFSNDMTNNRATTATSEGGAVDILLQKMDRFSQCEKLLDKNLFKQQYLKQLTRNKKHKTRK